MKRLLPFIGILVLLLTNCQKKDDITTNKISDPIKISTATTDILLEVVSPIDNKSIPVYITLPSNKSQPLKGMVVLHGSGGPWDDDDLDKDGIAEICNVGIPSKQTKEWRELLNSNGFLAAFPDSYSPRNTCENEGPYKEPPLKFVISGTFIRNSDAYAVLGLLKRLVWTETDMPVLQPDHIGVLGFSDGGTATISTLFNSEATPAGWQWKQSFSGITYTKEVLPPGNQSSIGGFRLGVLYYPGSYHNGYYGNLCNGSGIYESYADVLIHLAEDDPLTDNTRCLISTMLQNGGGVPTVYEYEGADHGFDGEDLSISNTARERTINFIKTKMGG